MLKNKQVYTPYDRIKTRSRGRERPSRAIVKGG